MDRIDEREIKLSYIIGFFIVVLSGFISWKWSSSLSERIVNMEEGVEIVENDKFQYAMDTQYSGGIWGIGDVVLSPVSQEFLSQEYGKIVVKTEKYTRHTRQVCTGSGENRTCRTEVYYTWDFYKKNVFIEDGLLFMGYEFSTKEVQINGETRIPVSQETIVSTYHNRIKRNYLYDKDKKCVWGCGDSSGDLRYSFFILPENLRGVMFIRSTRDGFINYNNSPCGCEIVYKLPTEIIESEKKKLWFIIYIFPFLLPLVILGFVLYYFYNN
jgi:hypothetical protein